MSKNQIFLTRSGANVSATVNGKTFTATLPEVEEARELFKKLNELKAQNNAEEICNQLSPSFKMNVKLDGSVERDRAGNYYLGGVNYPLPQKMKERIIEYVEDEIPLDGLIKFWQLLMLNPDLHVRESLFRFMDRFSMPITDNGYFIAYKSVYWKGVQNQALGIFISQQYVTMRANGQSLDDIVVVDLGNKSFSAMTIEKYNECVNDLKEARYMPVIFHAAEEWLMENHKFEWLAICDKILTAEEILEYAESKGFDQSTIDPMPEVLRDFINIGLLKDLFADLDAYFDVKEESFTDIHTQKMDIRLGKPVSMPREECDSNPNRTCSSGLHVGAPGYVSGFGGGHHRYVLACLVNPMNVVAIPHDYNFEKMRTCEYLPYAVCEVNDGDIVELDTKYFEDDYINYEKESLETKLGELDLAIEEQAEIANLIKNRLIDLSGEETVITDYSVTDETTPDSEF